MYSPELLDHFEHPRNVGELQAPDVIAETQNPACGDIMRLALKLSDQKIEEVRYKTRGCVASIACGSALTEMIAGKSLQQAEVVTREALLAKIGGLQTESMHASHLAIDCLKAALRKALQLQRGISG
jgi:nitrogen fixation protein NifU and related proteins